YPHPPVAAERTFQAKPLRPSFFELQQMVVSLTHLGLRRIFFIMMRPFIAVITLAACMPICSAQQTSLPDAPTPVSAIGPIPGTTAGKGAAATSRGAEPGVPAAPPEAGMLTMFPHSDTARYWISGQANSIFQFHCHFHSPYHGANSLIDDFE